jgi:hypothetical protein
MGKVGIEFSDRFAVHTWARAVFIHGPFYIMLSALVSCFFFLF